MKKVGFAFGTIIGVVVFIFGEAFLIENMYMLYFGKETPYFITSNLSWLPVDSFLGFFAVCLWLFSPYGLLGNMWKGEIGLRANCAKRSKVMIALGAFIVAMTITMGSLFWFERYTPDGMECYRFGIKKEYNWEDVESVSPKLAYDGCLFLSLTMKDGKNYGFGGGFFRPIEYSNDAYEEQFRDGENYNVWISRELHSRGVLLNVKNWNALEKKIKYDSDKELLEEIRKIYEMEGKE